MKKPMMVSIWVLLLAAIAFVGLRQWYSKTVLAAARVLQIQSDTVGGSYTQLVQGTGLRTDTIPVKFPHKFSCTPTVVLSFVLLDVGDPDGSNIKTNFRIRTFPSGVSDDGLDVNVQTWGNTLVPGYSVNWLAYTDPSNCASNAALNEKNNKIEEDVLKDIKSKETKVQN